MGGAWLAADDGQSARGSVIPAERFFAMLGAVDEEGALEAALTLTARGVGLDVSRLPQGGPGAAGERLAREAELARRGALPGALASGDPLRLYWQELEALPQAQQPGCTGADQWRRRPQPAHRGLALAGGPGGPGLCRTGRAASGSDAGGSHGAPPSHGGPGT